MYLVFLSCLLLSFSTVYAHVLLHKIHPLVTVFYTFVIAFVLVNLLYVNKMKKTLIGIKENYKYVLLINISTAVDWLFIFIALKFINASLVNCFVFGLAPITTLVISLKTYNSRKVLIKDLIVCLLVMLVLLKLSTLYYKNHEKSILDFELFFGIILSIISGVATGVTAYIGRLLYEKNFSADMVVKSRYVITILFVFLIILANGIDIKISLNDLLRLFFLSIVFIVAPAFLLQKGLEKILPLLAVVISATIPVLTYLFQFIEPGFIVRVDELIYVIMLSIIVAGTSLIAKMMKSLN